MAIIFLLFLWYLITPNSYPPHISTGISNGDLYTPFNMFSFNSLKLLPIVNFKTNVYTNYFLINNLS